MPGQSEQVTLKDCHRHLLGLGEWSGLNIWVPETFGRHWDCLGAHSQNRFLE